MENLLRNEDNLPVGAAIIEVEEEWRVLQANKEFYTLFGYEEEEFISLLDHNGMIDKRDLYSFEEILEEATTRKIVSEHEIRISTKDGKSLWVRVKCRSIRNNEHKKLVIVAFLDVNHYKVTENELLILNQQYTLLEDVSQEITFNVDVEKWMILRSKRLHEMRGEEMVDDFVPLEEGIKGIHPLDRDHFRQTINEAARACSAGSVDCRINLGSANDVQRYVWFRIFYKSIADYDKRVVRIIGRCLNIDQDKVMQEEIKRDPLTQLLNRVAARGEIQRIIKEMPNRQHFLFIVDLDNFKAINDTFGHTFGDDVIEEAASTLRDHFRSSDVVARVGGDEFLVFMKDTSIQKATEKAESLCIALEKGYTGDGVTRKVTSSIGISVFPKNGNDYSELFEKADHAMYRAKKAGKNMYEFAKSTDTGPIHKERQLDERDSLGQEEREFVAYAANLLSHARNIDGSINMLLKKICTKYHLDSVLVFEYMDGDKNMVLTNQYSETNEFYHRMKFERTNENLNNIENGSIAVEIQKNQSLAVTKFEYISHRICEVMYLSDSIDYEWKSEYLETFRELARLMTIFVSLRYRMDESKEEIRAIQSTDELTGFYKVDCFRQLVAAKFAEPIEGKVYAIEYFDISNFGYMNENYGHQVGDKVLTMLADDFRNQSYFIAGARLYSDYFVVLIVGDNEEEIQEKLETQNRRFMNMQNHQYPNSSMKIAAGVYVVPSDERDVEMAIENATLAWKISKNSRFHNIVFFEDSYRETRARQQQVIGEFYEALYRDDFRMFLQPKFLLDTGEVYGAEALARWCRPDGTILNPISFIESIEQIGYITELDFYIYEEAIRTLAKWKQQNRKPMILSTNFSGRHFENDGKNFVNRIVNIIKKYPVSPSWVEIEITEGVLVKNLDSLKDCLDELRDFGFRIAIDDFGTGYSSLSVLTDMPADVVKMDKSFIDGELNNKKKDLLVEIGKLVAIAEKEIIYEGIETKEQAQFLIDCGAKYGQGFLCNRPVQLGEFENLYLVPIANE